MEDLFEPHDLFGQNWSRLAAFQDHWAIDLSHLKAAVIRQIDATNFRGVERILPTIYDVLFEAPLHPDTELWARWWQYSSRYRQQGLCAEIAEQLGAFYA